MEEEITRCIDLFDSSMLYVESDVQARELLDGDLRRLACAMQALDESERRFLGRVLSSGMSVEGVAGEFGLSRSGARSELRRVEGRLLEAMERMEVPLASRAYEARCPQQPACELLPQPACSLPSHASCDQPFQAAQGLSRRVMQGASPCAAREVLPYAAREAPTYAAHELSQKPVPAFVPQREGADYSHSEWGRHAKRSRSRRSDRRVAFRAWAPAR